MTDGLLTYADVAARLRVSPRQAKRIMDRKRVPVVDCGYRTKRFRPVDVERLIRDLAGIKECEGGAL